MLALFFRMRCLFALLLLTACNDRGLEGPGGDGARDLAATPDLARAPDLASLVCGSRAGNDCPAGYYCELAACGAADQGGTCQLQPNDCTGEATKVECGCNGTTYLNPCLRKQAGVSYATFGPCPRPPDCRVTGCQPGYYCDGCLTPNGVTYHCIQNGAAC
jgi:hypothetical protein